MRPGKSKLIKLLRNGFKCTFCLRIIKKRNPYLVKVQPKIRQYKMCAVMFNECESIFIPS